MTKLLGMKDIKLDEHVKVPDGKGSYVDSDMVTVLAPGIKDLDIHHRMKSVIQTAAIGMAGKITSNLRKMAAEAEKERRLLSGPTDPSVHAEPEEDEDEGSILVTFQAGLEPDEYVKLMQSVQKILTSNERLAFLHANDGAKIPITDEAWQKLTEGFGLDIIERIIGVFMDFFTGRTPPKK